MDLPVDLDHADADRPHRPQQQFRTGAGRLPARLAGMVQVIVTLATDREAVVPALHDTPYGDPGWDEELYELYGIAAAVLGGCSRRGGTIREPLLVRAFGGARLDAMMTGVDGSGEASLLLPPCPAATVEAVLTELIGRPDVVSGQLRGHGPAATRRRWTRAMTLPGLLAAGLAVTALVAPGPLVTSTTPTLPVLRA